jgi:polysaccharide deacetylase 2 family uncharacterized protein YibQ
LRDEINDPLGSDPKAKSASGHFGAVAAGLALTALAAGVFGAARWGLADFGRPAPLAVARIEAAAPAPSPASTVSNVAASGVSAFASGEQVEKASGVKVTRNGGGGPPGALIIDVPQALGVRLAAAPDPRLVEKSKFGDLPRVGADGSRPADIYARPIAESVKLRNAPRVAILVGGLGIDAAVTRAAISQLPSGISLGFAPYGDSLRDLAANAREDGHEILLQAPMEGFGAQTAGPHTLMAGAAEPENRDSLKWMMARFPGFVGVSNYLGAKFTADSRAFAPVLAELGSRGLLYLDDGSSPRSLTASLAPGVNLRAAQADLVIDASPTPEDIEIALAKLETIARRQGVAIGVATALPLSLEHITHWADALEARGIALTPVSAAIGRNAMRSAQNP